MLFARIHSPVFPTRSHSSSLNSAKICNFSYPAWSHTYVVICKESTAICKCNLQRAHPSRTISKESFLHVVCKESLPRVVCQESNLHAVCKESFPRVIRKTKSHTSMESVSQSSIRIWQRKLSQNFYFSFGFCSHMRKISYVSQRGITFLFIVPGITRMKPTGYNVHCTQTKKWTQGADSSECFTHNNSDLRRY
jgi:hypothetical protein